MMLRIVAAVSVMSVVSVISVHAETFQVQCGALSGYSYYAEENGVPVGKGGWGEDKISDGEMVVSLNTETSDVTYLYKDASGLWQTPEQEGGATSFISLDSADGSFQFLVAFDDLTLELITIAEIQTDNPKMLFVSTRNGPAFTGAKLMQASCIIPSSPLN